MKATLHRRRVVKWGADSERIWSLLRLAHFIQVPIRKPGVKNRLEQTCKSWEKRKHSTSCQTQDSTRLVEFGDSATGGKDHMTTKTHTNAQSEIPESSWARTITHCPPPHPPLREGHHSGPNGLANSDPEPPLAPRSSPPPQNSPSSLFLSTSFAPLLSSCLCLLLFVFFFL